MTWLKYVSLLVGVVCVTVIECVAISKGINGVVLSGALAVIGAMVGFAFGYFPQKK